ncbi:MAG: tetratricopeptide repeat protein [Pseudomonadota bacterium]
MKDKILKLNLSLRIKSWVLFFLILVFVSPCLSEQEENLFIEITNGNSNPFKLNINEIVQIVINERTHSDVGVELELPAKYRKPLYDITANNIGEKMKLRVGPDIVYFGLIMEPLENGILVMNHSSMEEALQTIRKLGIEIDSDTELTNTNKKDLYRRPAQNENYEKAIQALTDGDYGKAERLVLKAIDSDPNEPSFYGLLSTIYYIKGDYKLALVQCLKWEDSIKSKDISEFPGVFQSLGDLYTKKGDYTKAEAAYIKYLSVNNNNLKIHYGLAITYEKSKQYELSMQQFTFLANSNDQYFIQIGLEGINRLKSIN